MMIFQDLTGQKFGLLTVQYRVDGFIKTQQRDLIKNEYCLKHNISLLRLPYTLNNQEIKQTIYKHHLSVTTAGCV